MPGDGHAGCGKRPGETGRSKDRNRAPGRFHHPHTGQARGPAEPGPQAPSGWDRTTLAHPALTGLPRKDLGDLVAALAAPRSEQREQDLHQRRGSDRQRAPGAGPPPRLTLADRVLATLLHQHLALPCPLLAQLLGVNRTTISRAVQETRPLLIQHGLAAGQPAARLYTLADISAYAASQGITPQPESKSAC